MKSSTVKKYLGPIPNLIRYVVLWPSDTKKESIERLKAFLKEERLKWDDKAGFISVELRGSDPATHAVFTHNINKLGFVLNQNPNDNSIRYSARDRWYGFR